MEKNTDGVNAIGSLSKDSRLKNTDGVNAIRAVERGGAVGAAARGPGPSGGARALKR